MQIIYSMISEAGKALNELFGQMRHVILKILSSLGRQRTPGCHKNNPIDWEQQWPQPPTRA